jgi:hypothetical protein
MKPVWVVLACALSYSGLATAQTEPAHAPRLSAQVYRSNFAANLGAIASSGSRDGWESFPLAEDAGYDPTLQPETHDGASSLVREAAPTQSGKFSLGFIRRMHIAPGLPPGLSFKIRVPYASGDTPLAVRLFFGQREQRMAATAHGDSWQQIRLLPHASQDTVTALAITIEFPHGIQGRNERVELRDVRFEGIGVARIKLTEPTALWDESRDVYYLRRAVRPGETLRVHGDTTDADGTWTLTSPDGKIRATGRGTLVEHRFEANDVAGIWTLRLSTPAAEAVIRVLLQDGARGLLFDKPPPLSPELLASVRKRRDQLRAMTHAETGNNIAQMDPHWALAGLPAYFEELMQPPELAMLDAMDYRATGDKAALAEAQAMLRSMAAWPTWTHPWFPAQGLHSYYPVGITAKYVVLAEQFLGPDLPADLRTAMDHALMVQSVVPTYEEYVQEDRLQFNISNWIGNTAGGALLAALQSRDPDAAGYALGLFEKDRDHVLAAYTSDGSYGEGITYHRFDLEMTSLVAEAAKRVLGTSLDGALGEGERYLVYAAYGEDGVLDYGDSHVDLRPSNVFAYQAAQNQSASMRAFYFKYRDVDTAELISRVLWEARIRIDPPITSQAWAGWPVSALFDRRGIAILRDGWNPDDTVIAMRAGENFNHNHADEGSVFYAKGGVLWLGEAGYADYYKDPSYPTFNTQAVGHNTLLLDGNGESQVLPGNHVFGASPHFVESSLGTDVQMVDADLSSAYGGALQRYHRTVVHVSHGPLIVVDQFRSDAAHRFTQLWHPIQTVANHNISQNVFTLKHDDTNMTVYGFSTLPLSMKQEDSPLPLTAYELSTHQAIQRPVQIGFTTDTPAKEGILATVIDASGVEHVASERVGSGLRVRCGAVEVDIASPDAAVEILRR